MFSFLNKRFWVLKYPKRNYSVSFYITIITWKLSTCYFGFVLHWRGKCIICNYLTISLSSISPLFQELSSTHKKTSHMEQVLPCIFPSGPWMGSFSLVQGSWPFLTYLRYSLHNSCEIEEARLRYWTQVGSYCKNNW